MIGVGGQWPKGEEPQKGGSWDLTLNNWFASEKHVPWARGFRNWLALGEPVLPQTTKALRSMRQNPENKGNG